MSIHELNRQRPQLPKMTLDQFRDGDAAAFRAYFPRLVRFAERFMNGNDGAEDLVQTVWARSLRALSKRVPADFAEKGGVESYLKKGIVNERKSQVRARSNRERLIVGADPDLFHESLEVDVRQNFVEGQALGAMQNEVDLEKIKNGGINPDFMDALVLVEAGGLSYKEAAEILHVPEGTVQSRVYRGKRDARKVLQGTD